MRFYRLTKKLGARIVDIAIDMGMNLETLAEHCHMSRDAMYDIVKGKRDTFFYNTLKICRYTKKNFDELFSGLEELVDDSEDNRKKKQPVMHKGKKKRKRK